MSEPICNLAVVRGALRDVPVRRELANGTVIVQFDVDTTVADGARTATVSVPIAWHDPATSVAEALVAGSDVVVVGTVRRRFFRVGGATQSRTEVVADRVVPARRVKTVRSVLAAVADELVA